jgi:hypothetical protein
VGIVVVTYESHGYNDRRYSKPWIAKVTAWPVGGYPVLAFGSCVDGEIAELDAEVGDLVKYGQKDLRKPRGTTNEFAIVEADGGLLTVSASQARAHYNAPKAQEAVDCGAGI